MFTSSDGKISIDAKVLWTETDLIDLWSLILLIINLGMQSYQALYASYRQT